MNGARQRVDALDVFTCPLAGVNLIEASAGTGKTWTICGLYLRLLLEQKLTVQQILVVTFTNAATAELRERIRSRIVDLLAFLQGTASSEPDRFIRTLADNLRHRGLESGELIARLEFALSSFDEAAILTIHGFCQRALADNPFAAGLPMRTELVESDRDLLMEAVQDFWRRHVAHAAVTPAFARYLQARGDKPDKYAKLLQRHLAKPLARHVWPAGLDDAPSAEAVDPAAGVETADPMVALEAAYQAARMRWLSDATEIRALLKAAARSLDGRTYKDDTVRDAAAHWDLLCRDDDSLAPIDDKAHLFRDSKLAEKTNKNGTTPRHEFFTHVEAYLQSRDALENSLFLERCRLLKRLFADGTAQLQALKRSRQVVAFNDMLANLHERLHHPDYPWLAAAIRARFPAALIDEFQDTDPLQLAIFRAIYDSNFYDNDSHSGKDGDGDGDGDGNGNGNGNGDHDGNSTNRSSDGNLGRVFLVGDPKQAIYGFRHADLHSYLRATRWAGRQWALTDNQRSSETLLTALNGLFGRNSAAFVLPQVSYRHVGYGDKPRAVFDDRSAPRAALQVWRLPDDGGALPKARARQAAVTATAAEIARLLQAALSGEITLDGHALRPSDIAVLVRSRALGSEVKRALAALDVGAVELSRDGIFAATDAEDWQTVLTAIAAPTRDSLLRAALATDLLGCDAAAIERIAASDTLLSDWIARFMTYRELWVNRGFGALYRQLLIDQGVAARLLARPDGDRRLTNCLHVGEELLRAAQTHASPEALLRYLAAARDEDDPLETAQLRLESDQTLVKIVTIHACKGLEYPIVFCPFLCDGGTRTGPSLEGYEYHDADLQPVIDFNRYDKNSPELAPIEAEIKREKAAETVRLLYVALTRAVHRCYLVMGPYDNSRARQEHARSMLNWLAAGNGRTPEMWFNGALTTAELDVAWDALAAASGGALVIEPLPTLPGTRVPTTNADASALTTPAAPRSVGAGWRLSSYSGLTYGARSDASTGDHDARASSAPPWGARPVDVAMDDILRFPRGAEAGECIHRVFETVDFADPQGWPSAIAAALASQPPVRAGAGAGAGAGDPAIAPTGSSGPSGSATSTAVLTRMLMRLVEDVTAKTLRPGLQLAGIPMSRRLTELEFTMPVPHLSAAALNSALKQHGYEVPSLAFGALDGYLKGFIDLVFEHGGRYFVLDWKSNHLGYSAADYGSAPMERAMADHGYHLQYLIYVLALDRYLAVRVPGYRYEQHVGGVLYLFVRGVRAAWRGDGADVPGVFFHRPTLETIDTLRHLLGSAHAQGVVG